MRLSPRGWCSSLPLTLTFWRAVLDAGIQDHRQAPTPPTRQVSYMRRAWCRRDPVLEYWNLDATQHTTTRQPAFVPQPRDLPQAPTQSPRYAADRSVAFTCLPYPYPNNLLPNNLLTSTRTVAADSRTYHSQLESPLRLQMRPSYTDGVRDQNSRSIEQGFPPNVRRGSRRAPHSRRCMMYVSVSKMDSARANGSSKD